ncbi:hypothetical protein [Sphingopyxis sp. PET50]|uniref:hypothetical protein n=1 Tax=Sphingopyxis sp. PET50 TaxID=2976533 RepID=UPI0021B06AB1|nr:hypothetical protein [Sphingopyxis sp. PET50]
MIDARAIGAGAIGDAGLRDLASEYQEPRVNAARGDGRRMGVGSRAGERRVVPVRR